MKKNYFTPNYAKKTIEGTKAALKRATVMGSPEFNELCEWMKLLPTFEVRAKDVKKNEAKKTYGGLTIAKMREYIETQSDSENALKKFEAVQRVAKAKNAHYPLTKKWFLSAYPEYKEKEVSERETDNAAAAAAEDARLEEEAAKELKALANDIAA